MTHIIDELRARADRHKPTASQLRREKLSPVAWQTLFHGRDMLAAGYPAEQIVADLTLLNGVMPIASVRDVWPDVSVHHRAKARIDARLSDEPPAFAERRFPLHAQWDALAERVDADWEALEDAVPADFDPTDAELERSWNGPDAHEAHRAAWVLHQEAHS